MPLNELAHAECAALTKHIAVQWLKGDTSPHLISEGSYACYEATLEIANAVRNSLVENHAMRAEVVSSFGHADPERRAATYRTRIELITPSRSEREMFSDAVVAQQAIRFMRLRAIEPGVTLEVSKSSDGSQAPELVDFAKRIWTLLRAMGQDVTLRLDTEGGAITISDNTAAP